MRSKIATAFRWYGTVSLVFVLLGMTATSLRALMAWFQGMDAFITGSGLILELCFWGIPLWGSLCVRKAGKTGESWTTACILCLIPWCTYLLFWPIGVVLGAIGLFCRKGS